jgi:hypothetical protein
VPCAPLPAFPTAWFRSRTWSTVGGPEYLPPRFEGWTFTRPTPPVAYPAARLNLTMELEIHRQHRADKRLIHSLPR